MVACLAVLAAVLAVANHASLPWLRLPAAASSRVGLAPNDGSAEGRSRPHASSGRLAITRSVWPADGQAAFIESGGGIHAGPHQHAAAIASLAKVMTAYLVLLHHPLAPGQSGPTITLSAGDVADTEHRRNEHQSVVAVAAGERLTELQALQALLLPSANNVAAVLARWDAGSEEQFVAEMNDTARSLGMTNSYYTDPSGFDSTTVSTAVDQLRLVDRAMRIPAFARIVATEQVTLPVAGIVHNTDVLLGHGGFVGVKTGNTDAAGGCFAFRVSRVVRGRRVTITGVVLGQHGRDQLGAGLVAAAEMVDRILGRRGASGGLPGVVPPAPAGG
jgi:D-alanyl-D-alanine carboxypeptidase (penicillin-binding protein 5/6)